MSFTQNIWDQHDIVNKIKILTKQGIDKKYAVIPEEYQKYPSPQYLNMGMFWIK